LDPPPPNPGPPAEPLPEARCPAVAEEDVADAEEDVAVAEGDVVRPTESPIAASITAAATIHPLFLFDSNRRTLGRRVGLAMVAKGPVGRVSTRPVGRVSGGLVGS
jgi:hypothetical protein